MNEILKFNSKQIDLILAAETHFAAKGYAMASIRAIAEEAKMNPSMIGYYFGSKTKLLKGVLIYRMSDFNTILNQVRNSESLPRDRVVEFAELFMDWAFANPKFCRIVNQMMVVVEEKWVTTYLYSLAGNFSLLKSIINDGRLTHQLKEGIDAELLIYGMLGTLNQVVINPALFVHLHGKKPETLENLKNRLKPQIKLVIEALL